MENQKGEIIYHPDIHASIIFQLGEDLISDPVQALVELIKNAYDADSDYAKVTIEISKENDIEKSRYRGTTGYIKIEDNGVGMDLETIKRGWLTISNSLKREMKGKNKKTRKGRTFLGDKGLGRLGAQRLGYNLEIFTKPENEDKEYHVALSWREFENKNKLDEIPIYIKETSPTRLRGTKILISDIKEQRFFTGIDFSEKLQDELSRMISPYREIEKFTIVVSCNGKLLDLAAFSGEILRNSHLKYRIDFDTQRLKMMGKARLSYIRPFQGKDRSLFKQLVEIDRGDKFFSFLSQKSEAKKFNLAKSLEEGWFVEFNQTRVFEDLDKLEFIEGQSEKANPGKFHGQIDYLTLSQEDAYQNVWDSYSDYKKYIKSLSGIRVYRDGFAIRVDRDWLGLGKQSTSGLSFYGLRLENTLGYIALTANDNRVLEETTDREGFKVNPYYNNFYEVLQQFIEFTARIQEFLRRGWHEFKKTYREQEAGIDSPTTPEEIIERMGKSLGKVSEYHLVSSKLKTLLTGKVPEAGDIISSIDDYLEEISGIDSLNRVLEEQVKTSHEQLAQLYEVASLGITAEALSHEMHTITDGLYRRIKEISAYIKSQPRRDPRIMSFIEHVNSSMAALRKEMSHFAPSLKYVREKREKIEICPFCRETAYYYQDKSKGNDIDVQITPQNADNFYLSSVLKR